MPVTRACAYLGVSRSGYYEFSQHTPSSLEIENTALAEPSFSSMKGGMEREGYKWS